MGKQYLIHAYRGTGGPWSTIICAGNRLARDAAVFLSQVRAQRRGDKVASLYGVLRRVQQPLYPAWTNSVRGWARGFQVFVQRRAANNLNGWVAYAYGRTYARDGVTGSAFDADYDQRHSVRVYGSYRLKPTINLSGKWIWATGLPVRGYFAQASPEEIVLSTQRNQLRLPAYQRVDFRINKAFLRRWGQLTLFAEVINLTNRENVRFDDLRSYDALTGAARLSFDTMFPILPSAGLVIDF